MTSMSITTLAGKSKKRWTLFFVVAVIGIVFSCLAVMNHHYDSLARYPYRDQKSRELIKQYLNEEEIAYIIEYSIPPNMFIAFRNCKIDDFTKLISLEIFNPPAVEPAHAPVNIKNKRIEWEKAIFMLNTLLFASLAISRVDGVTPDSVVNKDVSLNEVVVTDFKQNKRNLTSIAVSRALFGKLCLEGRASGLRRDTPEWPSRGGCPRWDPNAASKRCWTRAWPRRPPKARARRQSPY